MLLSDVKDVSSILGDRIQVLVRRFCVENEQKSPDERQLVLGVFGPDEFGDLS